MLISNSMDHPRTHTAPRPALNSGTRWGRPSRGRDRGTATRHFAQLPIRQFTESGLSRRRGPPSSGISVEPEFTAAAHDRAEGRQHRGSPSGDQQASRSALVALPAGTAFGSTGTPKSASRSEVFLATSQSRISPLRLSGSAAKTTIRFPSGDTRRRRPGRDDARR